MNKFATLHPELLKRIVKKGEKVKDERTGADTRTLGPWSFNIDLSDGTLPQTSLRRTYPKTAAAELAWFLTGEPEASFLKKHTTIWNDFLEELSPIGRPGEYGLRSAYGYRWRNRFDIDQLVIAIERLKRDKTSRQIWISSWDPNTDLLGGEFSSNVPCPVGFTFRVINNKLHSLYVLRSSDSFVGLPYDVMCQSLLMGLMANTLGVGIGSLQVTVSDLHVYESHITIMEDCMRQRSPGEPVQLLIPKLHIEQVMNDPGLLVDWVLAAIETNEEYQSYQGSLPKSIRPGVYV